MPVINIVREKCQFASFQYAFNAESITVRRNCNWKGTVRTVTTTVMIELKLSEPLCTYNIKYLILELKTSFVY